MLMPVSCARGGRLIFHDGKPKAKRFAASRKSFAPGLPAYAVAKEDRILAAHRPASQVITHSDRKLVIRLPSAAKRLISASRCTLSAAAQRSRMSAKAE